MEIKRDAYLEQLKIRKDNGMIKIITGIRRCGKSFLLFVLFKKYLLESGVDNDHIIEIALDGIENEELRDPKKCYQHIKDAMKDDQKYYLLLDEVQFMSRFEEVLNSLLRISNIDVYVTGSNSKFLSSDIVTEFRGRGDEIRIYPLSFAEFYAAFGGDYDDAWEEYLIYGGLPQVVQFSMERQKAEYLKNIFTNVYIKDVVERNKLRNVDEIDTLVDWKGYFFLQSISPVSCGLPISTVTVLTVFPSTCNFRILIPDSVSKVISVLSVNPYSYTYLPTQRLPLPHIIASEPSALKIRILKSALSETPINISPSLPIPV